MKKFTTNLIIVLIFIYCCSIFSSNNKFTLVLSGLEDNQTAPIKYVSRKIGGQNISPGLEWVNPPEGTKAFIITCIDKNPIANNWVHWMLLNIPANINKIPEDFSQNNISNCIICKNSFGYLNYGGPQPPPGTGFHQYVFTLYALNSKLKNIKQGKFYSEKQLLKMMQNKILKTAVFNLYYQ